MTTQQLTEKCLVTLRYDRDARGRIARLGPEQSIVRWANGNETTVVNTWVERIEEDDKLAPLPKMKAPGIKATKNHDYPVDPRATPTINTDDSYWNASPAKPKRAAPDDDLVADIKSKIGMDAVKLKAFATVNGCWDSKYDALPNPGLVRMSVVNRLRAKVKKGHEVVWP